MAALASALLCLWQNSSLLLLPLILAIFIPTPIMATKSFNHLKGKNTSVPPRRGKNKILYLILEDFVNKRDQSFDAQKGRKETIIGLFAKMGNIKVGILEDLMLKLKGKNESSSAQKRENSSLPPRRGMIKVRILDELLQQMGDLC